MAYVKPGVLRSSITVPLPDRYTGRYANPIGSTGGWGSPPVTRETLPMASNAPPRVQHPKLNRQPWSTSMAIKRKAMPASKSKKAKKGLWLRWHRNLPLPVVAAVVF
jgi:hypothetical protein